MGSEIVEFIKDVNNNQLLILLFSGGIIWTVLSNIRSILRNIWEGILACISFTVNSVTVGDYYDRPSTFVKTIKVLGSSRVLWERHTELQSVDTGYLETRVMDATYGRSLRWMWGHFMVLEHNYSLQSTKLVETVCARVFFARKRKFIKRLIEAVENCPLVESHNMLTVNMGNNIFVNKPKRSIESVYTNDGVAQRMFKDVKAFLGSRDVYDDNNSPYKFVGLLCGTPGSGKTSTIHAIASELDMDIRFVNTDKEDFESIARLMTVSTKNDSKQIIVIEDVDCISMNANESRHLGKTAADMGLVPQIVKVCDEISPQFSNGTTLSLSAILNLLDGIVTPHGIIVFLTTNNPEKLDSALLRDGRIDARYDFGNLNGYTANRMLKEHLGFTIPDIKDDIVPASLQRDILKVSIGRMGRTDMIEKYSNG